MSVVDVEAPADGGGDTASEGVTPPEGGSPKSDAGRKPSFAVADSHLGALAAAAGGPAEDEGPTEYERRLAWIKHYVKAGEREKAVDLGWDGDEGFLLEEDDV